MDFLLGFFACYAVAAVLEARSVIAFNRREDLLRPLDILLTSLCWPWVMWQLGEDDR